MDGWMGRWMDGWMGGQIDGWIDRWVVEEMGDGWMDRWREGGKGMLQGTHVCLKTVILQVLSFLQYM